MNKNKQKRSVRLEAHISPVKYTLTIKPDLETFTFSGHEIISLSLSKDTKSITLHSKNIDIKTVKVSEGKTFLFANKISYNEKEETATFTFKNTIKKGNLKLSIIFEGIISEGLRGFYRSKYILNGETKDIATTQFEATDARRAFPCFDEPAHKAVFDVSLIIPNSHTAISNTLPVSIKEHEAGYKIVEFSSTPRMSTYLLAFIIGEFEFVENKTKDGTLVRVFTTPGKTHQAKFALDTAIKSLEFYNEYFDIPYPLPVLDMIAIPDFESAAMENWGAIVYRETAILVDEEKTSLSSKQWVATVVAHEIAHQWFGNLVTMHWWTDLWLNEGFAEFIQNVCLNHLYPNWHVWDLYLGDARYAMAMRLDALSSSHPIQVEVHHPSEINEVFDMISYAKGSAVLRQLEEFLRPEVFQDGLRHYLKKHSYKNTETINLWESFEKVSKINIRDIMQAWILQTGYPLVTISKKKNLFMGTQERFFSSRIERTNKDKTLWQIPIIYISNGERIKMLATKKTFPLLGTRVGKVNSKETSFMRVRYDKETLLELKKEIEEGKMSVVDRLGIIRDLFALAEGGYIGTDEALEFSLVYKNEKEYIVWAEIAMCVNKVYNIIKDEKFKEKYKSYALSLFSPLAKEIGFEGKNGEDHSHTFLRSLALSQASLYGDKSVTNEAKNLFRNKGGKLIKADIRSLVYNIVALHGGAKEWENLKKLHDKEHLHEEKERFARALTMFQDKTLLAKTLMFTLSKDVRDQDAPHLIAGIWSNTEGRDLTWQFVKHNWPTILKRYGEGGHFLSRLLSPLGSHTKTKDITDAKKFFMSNVAPGADRTLLQSYERIQSNAAWLKDDKKIIEKWLDNNF